MSRHRALTALALAFAACGAAAAQSHAAPAGPGCVLERQDHYLCNRAGFRAKLDRARTVRIDTERLDLFALQQVTKLVQDMGKQVALPEERPDLIFSMLPVDRSGRIDFGPNDFPLAIFSVSDPSLGSGRRALLWTETFDGQEDRPWPSVVVDLLRRFQADAQAH